MGSDIYRAMRVEQVIAEGTCGVTLVLDGALPAEPGQFAMVWLPGVGERPFSLMDDEPACLTIADVGPFTHALCQLRSGDRLWLRGPYGRGFALRGQRHLLVAGGSGMAGLTLLARRARAQGHEVVVANGARCGEDLMLGWRLEQLGCQVRTATDDGSFGCCGTSLDAVADLLDRRWPDAVYACGPEPMWRALAGRCDELGLLCWVSLEATMKCGIGVCGACHCGEKLVCADGPVFPAAKVL